MVAVLRGRLLPRWSKGYAGEVIASGGCARSQRLAPPHATSVDLRRAEVPTSRIRPTDKLDVRVLFEPELSCPDVEVDADGLTSLPLIDEVKVSALTTDDLGELVRTKLAIYVKEPRVDFLIVAPAAIPIFRLC